MSDLKRYYELHEQEYVRRFSAGHCGWDAGPYDEFFMRPFVRESLERYALDACGARALDLGCGAGALSCMLAEEGFDVVGVDISPSAIEVAKKMAADRELPICFEVDDVLSGDFRPSDQFDLIIDGHLLHCIVLHEERQRLLKRVREWLTKDGEFWIETMCLRYTTPVNPDLKLDSRGVVWAPVGEDHGCCDAVARDGGWWIPQRMIARSPKFLIEELSAAGLSLIDNEWYEPIEHGAPGGFRARCRI
ncbi:MAG: methyltransferase domain-containing protein [Planctomycetota bacterium]